LRKSLIPTLIVALIAGIPGLAAPQKSTTHKSGTNTKASHSATKASRSAPSSASKRTNSKAGASRQSAKGRKTANGRGKAQPTRRSYQQSPTLDRYREIQHALAGKGFYKGDENGVWGAESVDALKSFQREQNLNPTGKLDSVSLIALGLGPKRAATAKNTPSEIQRPQDDNRRTEGSERP
jgi:hypothetical protein